MKKLVLTILNQLCYLRTKTYLSYTDNYPSLWSHEMSPEVKSPMSNQSNHPKFPLPWCFSLFGKTELWQHIISNTTGVPMASNFEAYGSRLLDSMHWVKERPGYFNTTHSTVLLLCIQFGPKTVVVSGSRSFMWHIRTYSSTMASHLIIFTEQTWLYSLVVPRRDSLEFSCCVVIGLETLVGTCLALTLHQLPWDWWYAVAHWEKKKREHSNAIVARCSL